MEKETNSIIVNDADSITTNTTTSTFTVKGVGKCAVTLRVSANTGTNPTLDISLRTQYINGQTVDIANFPTILDNGTYTLYVDLTEYERVEFRQEVGGTSPDFTIDLVLHTGT